MANKFQLVDTFEQRTPKTPPETNWKLCLVFQEETTESLVCPYCLNAETLGVDTRQWLQTWSSLMN